MPSLYEVVESAEEGIYEDQYSDELYDNAHLLDILQDADDDCYRYTTDCDNNIIKAIPKENYNPITDIPFEELGYDDKEIESILEDEDELSEVEYKCEIWDKSDKFEIEIAYKFLGTPFDYTMKKAKEEFSLGDHISRSDLYYDGEAVEIYLDDDEYEKIALAVTGNKLADEE